MEKFRLERTGEAPLAFTGRVIAESMGRRDDTDVPRWHDLRVYRTKAGQLVLEVAYNTEWRGETGFRWARPVDAGDLAGALRGYDPTEHVAGFPATPANADRQRNLLAWIRARYEAQVTELLSAVEGTAEEID